MFRIKTDIRQYKCETKNKVEKLIRNWVIRPNDLIYSTDHNEWLPIGEHPAFMRLFGMLEEQEKNTPDTVVTSRSPYSQRAPVTDGAAPNGEPPVEEEEVTQLVERPQFDTADEADKVDESAISGDGFDLDEQNLDEGFEETSGEEQEHGDDEHAPADEPIANDEGEDQDSESNPAPEDARKTDVFDQEEISRSVSQSDDPADSEELAPPSAPEGVEPPSNDEVTMMTDRTLEMLKVTDEEAKSAAGDTDEEEITDVRKRDGVSDDADEAEALEDAEPNVIVEDQTKSNGTDKKSKKRLGRHDLPEELFATNEISSPEVRDKIAKLDELRELKELSELSESSEPTVPKAKVQKSNGNGASGGENWDVRLQEDSGVDEAWEEIAEDLRTTEDISGDAAPGELRETDEIKRDDTSEQSDAAEELEEDGDGAGDDDSLDDEEELEEEELDEVELDEEWENAEDPALIPGDFVSDGYKIPLPFPIRPTGDDIRRGLRSTKTSRSRKDRTYPLPQPKKLDDVHRRTFDLTPRPPRDQTVLLAVGVFIVIAIISVVVTTC